MMRTLVFATAVFATSAFTPAAFNPGTGMLQLKSVSYRPAARASAVSVAMISNPFNREPPKPKKPWGDENPYRIFGVNEEAPYEEVERAFKELVEENEGNEKYIMQLEMMKEDIFDQRLRARMSGALKSKVKESPFDAKLQVKKDPWWTKVAFLKKLVVVPDQKHAIQVSCLMGAFIVAGIAAPQLASTTMGFGFLSSMGFVYTRGTPPIARDDAGNPGESRPANYGALGKAVGLCGIMAGAGFMIANFLMASVALPRFIAGDVLVTTLFNVGLWIAAMFFQVQDDCLIVQPLGADASLCAAAGQGW